MIIPLQQACGKIGGGRVEFKEGGGDLDRYFRAYDVSTGKVLWQTRLAAPVQGFPVTYTAGGKQLVAVPTGVVVMKALTGRLSPDVYQPSGGSALYVFELPR